LGANGIEVWNSRWSPVNQQALDWWDQLLSQGYLLNAYGGTDYHRGEDALIPATWTYARGLDREAVMEGLRRGHTVLSDSAKQMHFEVTLDGKRPGGFLPARANALLRIKLLDDGKGVLTLHDAGGKVDLPLAPNGEPAVIDTRGRKFLRLEYRDPKTNSMLALSNAFFIRG
jgi:hypothetical protein